MSRGLGGTRVVWRLLVQARLREQPGRLLAAVLAIALGVALATAVFLVNESALDEFGRATRQLTGDADLLVQGPQAGFDEAWFVKLVRDPQVSAASPVLDLQAALPGRRTPLHVLGLDPFRAAGVQPALLADMTGDVRQLLGSDAILLSGAAAASLHLRRGDALSVLDGSTVKTLRVVGVLPAGSRPQSLGIMDIAAAQWVFSRPGRINRVDLRLRGGVQRQAFRTAWAARLPPGLQIVLPELEWNRARAVTRAYRVNLDMLALVTLLTGAFLVYATQSLSALRRRTEFGLLRALGLTGPQLERILLGEGALLGATGALLGVLLGVIVAGAALRLLQGDLGNGQLHASHAAWAAAPVPMLGFFLLGVIAACLGGWVPAREAARRAPALALRTGDAEQGLQRGFRAGPGLALLAAGALLAWLPPPGRLPLPGYASIGALLLGAVLLLPVVVRALFDAIPRTGRPLFDIALAQLRGAVGLSTASLATVVVSFSLMVAMAIMVHSFRSSFDAWLTRMLPADLQLRVPPESTTASWSASEQAEMRTRSGVRRVEFGRALSVYLHVDGLPVTLIARDGTPADIAARLPLVRQSDRPAPVGITPAWISESLQDHDGLRVGERLSLPLGGRPAACIVAGVWRDYAHPTGAVVVPRAAYQALTADRQATEAAVWVEAGASPAAVAAAIRAGFAHGEWLEILATPYVRDWSLAVFDRAFAITYGLEAIAVVIGLLGVSVAAGATAFARRTQFGMLRHIGMRKRQVLGMLAQEGFLLSGVATAYGLVLGLALSLVLVYVVNRQSFNWSIDLAVPWNQLLALSTTLIAAAAITSVLSGRAAISSDVIRAVREDW